MKKEIWWKRAAACFLAAVMALCPVLLGSPAAYAATDKTEDAGNNWILKYVEIPQRIESSVDTGAISSMVQGLTGLRDTLKKQLASADAATQQILTTQILLLESNISSLNQNLNQVATASDQMAATAQNLFITYNSLKEQRAELSRSLGVLKKNYEAMKTQLKVGMTTELNVQNMRKNLDTMESGIRTMDLQIEQLRKSIGLMVGGNYRGYYDDGDHEHKISIKGLPDVEKFIKDLDIHFTTDLEHMSTDSEKASLTNIYRDLRDKQDLLAREREYYELEQKNYEAAKKKYEVGLLSELGMVNAQDALDTEAAKVRTAELNLFTAAAKYDWAISYNIFN